MAKTRVYDLAKELGINSKELVDFLDAHGLNVRHYMSVLDEKMVLKVKKLFSEMAGGSTQRKEKAKKEKKRPVLTPDFANYFTKLSAIKGIYEFCYQNYRNDFYYNEETAKKIEEYHGDFQADYHRLENKYNYIQDAELPLVIGFFGQFKSGKSSVVNSILGEEFLGVDIPPCTATVTKLVYGPKLLFFMVTSNNQKKLISREEYDQWSVHDHNKAHQTNNGPGSKIDHFEIQIPNPVLQRFQIVDTPGFSSENDEDDQITRGWLNSVDQHFWVIDIDKGSIVADELEVLEELNVSETVLIVNRIDVKPPKRRLGIINKIREQHEFLGIFPYSAKQILKHIKGLQEHEVILGEAFQHAKSYMLKENEAQISIRKNDIQITTSEGKEVFLKKIPSLPKEEYRDNYGRLVNYFDDLRQNAMFHKLTSFERELKKTIEKYSDRLERLRKKIEKDDEACDLKINDFWDSIDKFWKYVEPIAQKEFENYQKELVKSIYNTILEHYVDGWIWKDNKIRLKVKDLEEFKKAIKKVVKKQFDTLANKITNAIQNAALSRQIYLNLSTENQRKFDTQDENFDKNPVTLDSYLQPLQSASYNSLIGLYNSFDFWIEKQEPDDPEKLRKIISNGMIHWCISDTEVLHTILDYCFMKLGELVDRKGSKWDVATDKMSECIRKINSFV